MFRHAVRLLVLVSGVTLAVAVQPAVGQLRITTWNITNYSSGERVTEFQTAIYDVFESRSMAPDILIVQEIESEAAVTYFLNNILNAAPNSPGDWAAATFVNGNDTDSALFYRDTVVEMVTDLDPDGVTVVAYGSGPPNHPRNIMRYDIRPLGHTTATSTLAIYSSHMKAGQTQDDQDRRLLEAERIRLDAEGLPAGWNFLLGGDFNIQTSSEAAYQELIEDQGINNGRFFDPIKTPGTWNNNSSFRFVHTQDPAGAGGMDDRHDQILVSESLIDETGFEYDGDATVAYSTTTWNDPNHSYRSWGNDGTSYNVSLTVGGNDMVGATIAQALIDAAAGGGHLPVFADFILPDITQGACCVPCGCVDDVDEAGCLALDGSFRGAGVPCGEEDPPCDDPPVPDDVLINEVVVRHEGVENQEFVELVGTPDELLCGLTVLVVEGDGFNQGKVDLAISVQDCDTGPCALDETGYFAAGGTGIDPDLQVGSGEAIFESGTQTFVLVHDCLVEQGTDLDTDNDGVAEVAVGTVLDAIGIVDDGYPDDDAVYFGAPPFGPDGTEQPPGAARCPDGADTDTLDDWVRLSYDTAGADGCRPFTPSATNLPCGGDFDGDGDLDLADFAGFQRCLGLANAECSALELDNECGIDLDDYAIFVTLLIGP